MRAAAFRRIERKPAEATSNVEEPMTFLEEKLRGKVALLCNLGVVEAVLRIFEVGTGILEVAVKEQRI
jgi:hypothetical protein